MISGHLFFIALPDSSLQKVAYEQVIVVRNNNLQQALKIAQEQSNILNPDIFDSPDTTSELLVVHEVSEQQLKSYALPINKECAIITTDSLSTPLAIDEWNNSRQKSTLL